MINAIKFSIEEIEASDQYFDHTGSVAKSTHAGIPWLRLIRHRIGDRVHIWPFDGWDIPSGCSAIAEVYPALWSRTFAREGRTGDQHDAYSIAACGSDNHARRVAKPRSNQAEILTVRFSPSLPRSCEWPCPPICRNSTKPRGNQRGAPNSSPDEVFGTHRYPHEVQSGTKP